MPDAYVGHYFVIYSWAHIVNDLRMMGYTISLVNWMIRYPPLVFFELNCVLGLHLTYPLWERLAARRFVYRPTSLRQRQLAFVQRHTPRPPKLRCLP